MMKKQLLIAGVACLLAASQSGAALIAYDGFDYSDGVSLDVNAVTNLTGGTGWDSGGWVWSGGNQGAAQTNASGGLTYGSLATTPGAMHWNTDTKRSGMYRNTTAGDVVDTAPGVSVWMSFLLNIDSAGASDMADMGSWVGFNKTTGNATNEGAIDGIQLLSWTASTSEYTVAAKMNNNYGAAVTLDADTTYLVVMELLDTSPDGNDTLNLFINPAIGAALGAPDSSVTGPYIGDNGIVGQVAATFGENEVVGFLDEIRMGDTFADVTPVPEPSSILLILGGFGALYFLRRKK